MRVWAPITVGSVLGGEEMDPSGGGGGPGFPMGKNRFVLKPYERVALSGRWSLLGCAPANGRGGLGVPVWNGAARPA